MEKTKKRKISCSLQKMKKKVVFKINVRKKSKDGNEWKY